MEWSLWMSQSSHWRQLTIVCIQYWVNNWLSVICILCPILENSIEFFSVLHKSTMILPYIHRYCGMNLLSNAVEYISRCTYVMKGMWVTRAVLAAILMDICNPCFKTCNSMTLITHIQSMILWHTLNVPLEYFMYDTRNMSTGTKAVVNKATDRARIQVMVELGSLS